MASTRSHTHGIKLQLRRTCHGKGNDAGAVITCRSASGPCKDPRHGYHRRHAVIPALLTAAEVPLRTVEAQPFPLSAIPVTTGWQQGEMSMAQDTSGTAGGTAVVVGGERAARVDRLPLSWMQWEIAFVVQLAWAAMLATDGPALRLYPYIWAPAKEITSSEYSVIYAFEVGIGILIGGYTMGWVADKIGRRKGLMIAAVLAAAFSWPFAYVTNYPALVVLSIFTGLGCGGALAINVVYLSEMTGPKIRGRVTMGGQVLAIIMLEFVLVGWIPHFMIPDHYQAFQWLLTGINLLIILPLLAWRMYESPRWLESREKFDQARKGMEKMEARVMKKHPVLPEPDTSLYTVVDEKKTNMFAVFSKQYVYRTVFMLVVFVLLYGGIVYGNSSYAYLFLSGSRGFSPGLVFELTAWGGLIAAGLYALNADVRD